MIRKMNGLKVLQKMSADFLHLCNHDASRTVYSALIRIIKRRRYRYVSRVKKSRTSIVRNKEYWRSPWGNLLREPSVKGSWILLLQAFPS